MRAIIAAAYAPSQDSDGRGARYSDRTSRQLCRSPRTDRLRPSEQERTEDRCPPFRPPCRTPSDARLAGRRRGHAAIRRDAPACRRGTPGAAAARVAGTERRPARLHPPAPGDHDRRLAGHGGGLVAFLLAGPPRRVRDRAVGEPPAGCSPPPCCCRSSRCSSRSEAWHLTHRGGGRHGRRGASSTAPRACRCSAACSTGSSAWRRGSPRCGARRRTSARRCRR